MRTGSEGTTTENWEAGITSRAIGTREGFLSASTLQFVILTIVVATVALNILLIFEFNRKLEIQPKDVIERLNERLEVTPKQVMERLDSIEREHMNYVNEFRKLHAKE